VAAIFNNFGNLELATGNPKWATDNFNKAMQIWVEGGDATAIQLAITHLCMGRVHTLRRNISDALKSTSLAETLFLRTMGADKGFMAKYRFQRPPSTPKKKKKKKKRKGITKLTI
jgi:hypothetical protein